MTLPSVLMLTDRHQLPHGRSLLEQVSRSVEAGVRAVVLRERDLDDRARADLASDLAALLDPVDGVLIVATPLPAPTPGPPRGVHLRADDPLPADRPSAVGRSCHGVDDVARARIEGVDYVVVGPVAPTASKPGYGPALGWSGLRALTHHLAADAPSGTAPLVYALGGVDGDNAAHWISAGADGLAVMGALMRADDPARVAAALLTATTRSHA